MSLPSVINQNAVSITSTTATLKGSLVDLGGSHTVVTVYFGLTDGGTTAANWDRSYIVGAMPSPGDFTAPVTGLLPSRVYYYTATATNDDGTAWVDTGASGSKSYWFGTLGVPGAVADSLTAARLEGHYRDDWVTSPDAFVNKGNVKWAAPICPPSFQISLVSTSGQVGNQQPGNVLTCYACSSANLFFDYYKVTGSTYHFDQLWSSPGRASYAPNFQGYNPYVTGKGVRVSMTPLYQGEIGVATQAWMLTRGLWKLAITTYINPIVPMSDGINYRLRLAASPRRVGGVESEFYNQVIASGNQSSAVSVDLRGDCFWVLFITLGANARDSGIPDGTHLCTIGVSASRYDRKVLTSEDLDWLLSESGEPLEAEHA